MRYILILMIFVISKANGQELWQLQPYAPDSTYFIGALPSGEPVWKQILGGGGTVTSVGLSTGTSGTDINVSGSPVTSSGAITLNIPTASGSNRGALSSTDWTTFNSKIGGSGAQDKVPIFSSSSSLTYNNLFHVNTGAGGPYVGIGTNSPSTGSRLHISDGDIFILGGNNRRFLMGSSISAGSWGGMRWNTSNQLQYIHSGYSDVTGVMLTTSDGFTGLRTSGTAPLTPLDVFSSTTSNNGTYQNWAYSASPTAYRLLLKQTVTDGNIRYNFSQVNNTTAYDNVLVFDRGNIAIGQTDATRKLDINGDTRIRGAIYDNSNSSGTSGQVLTSAGTGAFTWTTPATAITGTGANGYVPYFTGTSTLASTNVFFNSNGFGFNTTSPLYALHLINRSIYLQGNSTIIDKNNSFGPSGEFLMATGGTGVDWTQIQITRTTATGQKDFSVTGGSTIANALVPTNGTAGQVLRKGTSGYDWATPTSEQYAQLYLNGTSPITANTAALLSAANYTTLTYTGNGAFSNPQTNRIRCDFTGTVQIQIDATWQGGNGTATTHNLIVYKNGGFTTILPSITANDVALSGTQRGQHTYRNGLITDVASGDYFEFYYTAPSSTTLVIPLMTIRRIN
jgi:hypothetical protein